MGLIPDDKIAEIRERTDIVQIVGEYVSLKRSGVNHKGLCPFHQEMSPSFNVNAQGQFFHCFGCGKSGDVYSFLTEVEGKPFIEVVRELAKRAGIDLPEPQRSREAVERARENESERARMVRLNELVANWFRAQLETPAGEKARAYVEKRGIGAQVAETFKLGYAPAGWDALTRFLESKKVPHELAERAGLIKRRDNARLAPNAPPTKATHFDVFVDRVVYALTSPMGEPIGFGGRILDAGNTEQPKYKNSPETLLYKKGENLFGLHVAKHAIRKSGRALVVEGNFDVMTLHQCGLDYTVAPQGTALTTAQVHLIKRFAKEVIIMLDSDKAGRAATMKVVRMFAEAELKARIVELKARDGKKADPDDLARNDLPWLEKQISEATEAIEYFFTQVATHSEPSIAGRVAAVQECVPVIREIRDPMYRDAYAGFLAQLLRLDRRLVDQAIRGTRVDDARVPVATEPAPEPDRPARAIKRLHANLLAFFAQHATLIGHMTPDAVAAISDEQAREIFAREVTRGTFSAKLALEECAAEIRDAVAQALIRDDYIGLDAAAQNKALADILQQLRLEQSPRSLEEERKAALARGDMDTVRVLNARIRSTRLQGETSR